MTAQEKADALKVALQGMFMHVTLSDGITVVSMKPTRVDFGRSTDFANKNVFVRAIFEAVCADDVVAS